MLDGREILFAPVHVQQNMSTGDSFRSLSSTTKLLAFGFIALDTQLASIDLRIGAVSGSPVCNVFLVENIILSGQAQPLSTPVTGALASASNISLAVGANTVNFGANTLVPGDTYWIVLEYVSGTSAGVYYLSGSIFNQTVAGAYRVTPYTFVKVESATNTEPVTWVTPAGFNCFSTIRQTYTSGKTFGFLGSNGSDSTNVIRHRAETSGEDKGVGQAYIIPKGMRLNLKGFLISFRATNATALDVEFFAECYINRALVATSAILTGKVMWTATNAWLNFEFTPSVKVPENCELIVLVRCKYHADAYYYYTTRIALLDNHADEHMPQPIRRAAYYVNDGTGITVNQSAVTSCGLLLDPDEPFYPEPINRRTSTGR